MSDAVAMGDLWRSLTMNQQIALMEIHRQGRTHGVFTTRDHLRQRGLLTASFQLTPLGEELILGAIARRYINRRQRGRVRTPRPAETWMG